MMTDEETPKETTTTTTSNKEEEPVAVAVADRNADEEHGGGVTVAGLHLSDAQLPMVGIFGSALVLLIAILVPGRSIQYWAYGIALATVAMVFAIVGMVLTTMMTKEEQSPTMKQMAKGNAYFLFLWCFVGACIMTFSGPFTVTSNGYFASWSMAIASCMCVGVTTSEAKSVLGKMGALLGLGACAVVVIIAVIPPMRDGNYRNASIYALVLACCTVCLVAALYWARSNVQGKVKLGLLAFFALMWVVMACIVTFEGPFRQTGNGYFASWGGAIASVIATMGALKE